MWESHVRNHKLQVTLYPIMAEWGHGANLTSQAEMKDHACMTINHVHLLKPSIINLHACIPVFDTWCRTARVYPKLQG